MSNFSFSFSRKFKRRRRSESPRSVDLVEVEDLGADFADLVEVADLLEVVEDFLGCRAMMYLDWESGWGKV